MKNIQLVIPMSGIGKRFINAGYKDPKPLIDIDGHPMIKYVLDIFNNPEDVIFICNDKHLATTNMRDVLLKYCPSAKIYSVPKKSCRGPVEVILKHIDKIDDSKEIIISYCDYGTKWNYTKFLEEVRLAKLDGAIPCYTGFHPHMLGTDHYAYCHEENGFVTRIQEKKPFTHNKMDELASNGTYYFKSKGLIEKYFQKLVDSNETINEEFYVSMVYNHLIDDGLKVSTFYIDYMLQFGTPYDLEIYKQWSSYFHKHNNKHELCKNPPNTTLILPMAGDGNRFKQEGYIHPKPLLDVNGKPMFIRAIENLPKCDNTIIVCKDTHTNEYNIKEMVNNMYSKYSKILTIGITTSGQATTCKYALCSMIDIDKLSNPIFISSCDNGVIYDVKKYTNLVNDESIDVIVWSFRNNQASKNNPDMYAWLTVDENNFIQHVSCKKFNQEDPLKSHAIIGTFFFRNGKYFIDGFNKNFWENRRVNNEFYIDDVINRNIEMGLKVKVFEVDNYICWGTPNDYKTYNYWLNYFNANKICQ